jgi:hypothetical protein
VRAAVEADRRRTEPEGAEPSDASKGHVAESAHVSEDTTLQPDEFEPDVAYEEPDAPQQDAVAGNDTGNQ